MSIPVLIIAAGFVAGNIANARFIFNPTLRECAQRGQVCDQLFQKSVQDF